jgi:hypothetical protein
LAGGLWSGGLPFGLPGDQRKEDAYSLVYVSKPLDADLSIIGNPKCAVTVSSTMSVASVVAKLSDVAPDGQAALVSRGVFNLTRRNRLSASEAVEPGARYEIEIELDATAWRFEAGHRIRLALSGADFPNSWPSPEVGELTFHFGADAASAGAGLRPAATLGLPIAPDDAGKPPSFIDAPALSKPGFDPEQDEWSYEIDTHSGDICWTIGRSASAMSDDGVETASSDHLELSVERANPAKTSARGRHRTIVTESDDTFESYVEQSIESDEVNFNWTANLRVTRNGEVVGERQWERSFLREMM